MCQHACVMTNRSYQNVSCHPPISAAGVPDATPPPPNPQSYHTSSDGLLQFGKAAKVPQTFWGPRSGLQNFWKKLSAPHYALEDDQDGAVVIFRCRCWCPHPPPPPRGPTRRPPPPPPGRLWLPQPRWRRQERPYVSCSLCQRAMANRFCPRVSSQTEFTCAMPNRVWSFNADKYCQMLASPPLCGSTNMRPTFGIATRLTEALGLVCQHLKACVAWSHNAQWVFRSRAFTIPECGGYVPTVHCRRAHRRRLAALHRHITAHRWM